MLICVVSVEQTYEAPPSDCLGIPLTTRVHTVHCSLLTLCWCLLVDDVLD